MNKPKIKIDNFSFNPSPPFRNRHLQSILASSRLRVPRHLTLLENTEEIIISTDQNSKLLVHFSRHTSSRGLVIVIHGWEGSSSSAYVVAAGNHFYNNGYSVCRLNLRDHGESHHLNESLFHGALLEETFQAVKKASELAGDIPCYLIGFSLGGNYALRIAAKNTKEPIANLKHVFAISPPFDPYKTTLSIDQGPSFYRKYFLKKWKRSLRKKQMLFPDKYDFSAMMQADTCMELTAAIMPYFPDFPSYRDYFDLYTLKNDFFQNFNIPVTVLISQDDPVIPAEDFINLRENEFFQLSIQNYGGHCGFLDCFPFTCWHQQKITEIIEKKE